MYEAYSRQALPSKKYRELLGASICVFNSNNQFIIENILKIDSINYDWYKLVDKMSGQLKLSIKETITNKSDAKIEDAFSKIVDKRNRIIHSFQITSGDEQILSAKDKGNQQFHITEDYLLEFIRDNEELSRMLHKLKGY